MSKDTQRRLAAIVAADVAGYSRLVGFDEEGTVATLRSLRKELIDPLLVKNGGRVANTAGDSLLLEFPSIVDAVRCSIAVQEGMHERNREIDDDRRIHFRIGIHLGDVIAEGSDLLGDGVNIAARLQESSEPGGIAVSAVVHDYLDREAAQGFVDLGERELKNIRRPVRIWQRPAAPSKASRSTLVRLDKPSIAILPFDNMSGDPQQDYIGDGLTENIIASLSLLPNLLVIARNSTFAYKGKPVYIRQVADELGVRYVLEGSVQRHGEQMRVTAQLVDTLTGHHLWSDRYDRRIEDLFVVQDDVTREIVVALQVQLTEGE